jgi:AhpD family alkylhydroperoxidase
MPELIHPAERFRNFRVVDTSFHRRLSFVAFVAMDDPELKGPQSTNSGLGESLVQLVKMRASQINGCAYCLDMHSKDARALAEIEQRLYLLDAWEEAPFYSERERAALALTDAVTRITEGHVPDSVFERARAHFNEQKLIALVFTLTTINAWNRLAITMRTEVGNYQPKARPVSQTA